MVDKNFNTLIKEIQACVAEQMQRLDIRLVKNSKHSPSCSGHMLTAVDWIN